MYVAQAAHLTNTVSLYSWFNYLDRQHLTIESIHAHSLDRWHGHICTSWLAAETSALEHSIAQSRTAIHATSVIALDAVVQTLNCGGT